MARQTTSAPREKKRSLLSINTEMNNGSDLQEMEATAKALVAPGKGILAIDESFPTIEKRFKAVGITSNAENRLAYRQMLVTTPELGDFISGVILFDETIRQCISSGIPFCEALGHRQIIPGIKVDRGVVDLTNFPGEKVTEGLDGLRDRLLEYAALGARFSKWRAVIKIDASLPTETCLRANASSLARYAALSQEAGLVPIVEPETLMDGNHTIERHFQVTEKALNHLFQALREHHVSLEALLLKTNMVLPGKDSEKQSDSSTIAKATLKCVLRTVPAAVPGIVFLSGGQADVQATQNLNALNSLGRRAPWELSFSFGRALQDSALRTWKGSGAFSNEAQEKLLRRARLNSMARLGQYSELLESQ